MGQNDEMDIAWRRAAQSGWVEVFGRAGLVAKGVIYGLIGVLALMVAFGFGGRPQDRQERGWLDALGSAGHLARMVCFMQARYREV